MTECCFDSKWAEHIYKKYPKKGKEPIVMISYISDEDLTRFQKEWENNNCTLICSDMQMKRFWQNLPKQV